MVYLNKKFNLALEEKNADLLADAYHADAVRTLSGDRLEGLSAIQKNAAEFYKNVPDAVGTNHEILCSGNFLVARWTGTGTPNGSPKSISVTGIRMYKIIDGKVKEEWEEFSDLSLMMQMGFELKPPGN